MSTKFMKNLTLLDFFSGAGGWSEGFRQQGFTVVMGIDNWRPAVLTHNLNHGLNDVPMDILDYEFCAPEKIDEDFQDTEVIVGSPPCVSFSMSNKAGKADKSLGIRLIESYLRVVAFKKFKKGSKLVAWYMENVPNSRNFVQESYSFKDLHLEDLARSVGKKPSDEALKVKNNGDILCAADYGSPQTRERFVCGESLVKGKGFGAFLAPVMTHADSYVSLADIKGNLPSPTTKKDSDAVWTDPNYPSLKLPVKQITDQFYDTGVYRSEWEGSRAAKINHPFMGRMSFPEDPKRPSRTIMATRSASTREAIIYRSEFVNRKGDGEYRLPTIREASSLMGFPINYQFTGSEGSKWRQIGNAVCPHMSAAVAKEIRKALGLKPIEAPEFESLNQGIDKVDNLNTFKPKSFDKPPLKKVGAKFRSQPFKFSNLAPTLTNFDPRKEGRANGKWYTSVYVGAGKQYQAVPLNAAAHEKLEGVVSKLYGKKASEWLDNAFGARLPDAKTMQKSFEENRVSEGALSPWDVIEQIQHFVDAFELSTSAVIENPLPRLIPKDEISNRHLLACYALGNVTERINNKERQTA